MCEPGNHLRLQTERVKMFVCFGLVSRRNQEKKPKVSQRFPNQMPSINICVKLEFLLFYIEE